MADWSLWDDMGTFRRAMDRLLDTSWGRGGWNVIPAGMHTFPIGLYERDDDYFLCGILPGVKPEDLDLTVQGTMLTISGERKLDETLKTATCHFDELPYGRFTRQITLPTAVETEGVEANVDNGMLNIRLHKAAEARSRRIQVRPATPQITERVA